MRLLPILLLALGAPSLAMAQPDAVARGRYLAAVGDCEICHTAPGQSSKPYAGGYGLHAYFGTVYSTNLTPDDQTGIGRWTADQFHRALHDGIAADGSHLYPAFPYAYFTKLPRADSDALYAYLRSLKPVRHTPPPNELIFPTNIRFGMALWDMLFLDRTPLRADPSKSAQWNRGAEIVNGLGHCGGCHTPKTFLFGDRMDEFLQGATLDGWYAPNLTPSRHFGLGRWTAADIAQYLATGGNRFGRVTGAMQDVVRLSTSRMSDADRTAIAAYLTSLPAAPDPRPRAPDARAMAGGEAVFVARCAICHANPGQGYPALAHNGVVEARDPTTMLRVVLQGSQAVAGPHGHIGFSMPAFPVLSDGELADVATYLRNSWGNRADPVSKKDASDLRKLLGPQRRT
jgi:mono/diheme cytochrome c family protein